MSVDFTNANVPTQANAGDNIPAVETGLGEEIRNPLDGEYLNDLFDQDGEVVRASNQANAEAIKDTNLLGFPIFDSDDLDNDDQLLADADSNLSDDEERLDEISAQLESRGVVDQSGMIAAARYNDLKADEEVRYRQKLLKELEESRQQNPS